MTDPFLFPNMTEPAPHVTPDLYITKAEKVAFEVMEAVDEFFLKELTIPMYDEAEKRVKKIILEALREKSPDPVGSTGKPFLLKRESKDDN